MKKTLSIPHLSNWLMLQLLRFDFNRELQKAIKLHAPVSSPLRGLDLTEIAVHRREARPCTMIACSWALGVCI